jgi:hypothetical protein
MIKLEISLTGAPQEEVRLLEELMQKILLSLTPHMTGIEATVKPSVPVDPYAKTKEKILEHIRYRQIRTAERLTRDFWEVDIQDYLNPKDKAQLWAAIASLCDDGNLEAGPDRGTYYLTTKGFNAIY